MSLPQVTARKPRWEQGARAAIALKPRGAAAPALALPAPVPPPAAAAPVPAASVAVAKAWMLDVDGDGGEELLDDEDLLTEEDRARPAVPGAAPCGVPQVLPTMCVCMFVCVCWPSKPADARAFRDFPDNELLPSGKVSKASACNQYDGMLCLARHIEHDSDPALAVYVGAMLRP